MLISYFAGENITLDVLKILNYNQLNELTHSWKIGDKVVFEYNFEKWRQDEIRFPIYATNNITKSSMLHSPRTISTNSTCSSGSRSPQLLTNTPDSDEASKFNVLQILTYNRIGSRIIESYKKNKMLTDDQRTMVISIISKYFESNDFPMSLQTSYKLEKEILVLFPSEKIEFYRTERRGKIYSKYYNIKKSTKIFHDVENDDPTNSTQKSTNIQMGMYFINYKVFYMYITLQILQMYLAITIKWTLLSYFEIRNHYLLF